MSNAIYEAVLVVPGGGNANSNPMKEGHSCCGGCCDVRRATIIVNIIMLVLGVIGLSSANALSRLVEDIAKSENDGEDVHVDIINAWFYVIGVVGILCHAAAIYGAVIYNKYLVAASAVYMALTMFNAGIFSIFLNGFFIYPHIFLIKYIDNGIMSEDNYDNERQSCCCVAA